MVDPRLIDGLPKQPWGDRRSTRPSTGEAESVENMYGSMDRLSQLFGIGRLIPGRTTEYSVRSTIYVVGTIESIEGKAGGPVQVKVCSVRFTHAYSPILIFDLCSFEDFPEMSPTIRVSVVFSFSSSTLRLRVPPSGPCSI